MKIALLVTGLGMGGAERQVCDLADCFAAQGHEVMLLVLGGEEVTFPAHSAVLRHNLQMRKSPLGLLRALLRARALLRRFAPDVVHSHMVHANLYSRLLRLICPMPRLVNSAHSTNEGGRLRMLAYRATDKLADVFTNVSQEAVQAFEAQGAAPHGRMRAMVNGIDEVRFVFSPVARADRRLELGLADSDFCWLAVGRLTAAKDYPNLLHALTHVTNARLAVIGVGEDLPALQALVGELNLGARVQFLGLQREVSQWMSAADAFVLSSAWEGLPLVLLEAMLCSRLAVATDCGGVAEVLHGHGLLVPPGDSLALAHAMQQTVQLSVAEREQRGLAARESVVARFSLQQVAASWLALYQERT